jgi:hypothetical protein
MMMMDPFNVNLKHHTQEYIKWFNGIIPSTTYLGVSKFLCIYSFFSYLEPLSVEQALEDPDWIIGMEEELNNFKRNEVWELVARPKQNVIGTKWVCKQTSLSS